MLRMYQESKILGNLSHAWGSKQAKFPSCVSTDGTYAGITVAVGKMGDCAPTCDCAYHSRYVHCIQIHSILSFRDLAYAVRPASSTPADFPVRIVWYITFIDLQHLY